MIYNQIVTWTAFAIIAMFSLRGGEGVLPNPKYPYQKKLRWTKKGEGGLSFLLKVKKQFFMPPLKAGQFVTSQIVMSGGTIGCMVGR